MQFIVCQLYLDKTDFFFKDDSEKKINKDDSEIKKYMGLLTLTSSPSWWEGNWTKGLKPALSELSTRGFHELQMCLGFVCFVATLGSLQDVRSPTTVWTQATAVKASSPSHWTTREFPICPSYKGNAWFSPLCP